MSKVFTKKERTYQNSKKYSFRELEMAFNHSLKIIESKDKEIESLKAEVESYNKIFDDAKFKQAQAYAHAIKDELSIREAE